MDEKKPNAVDISNLAGTYGAVGLLIYFSLFQLLPRVDTLTLEVRDNTHQIQEVRKWQEINDPHAARASKSTP